MLGATLAAWLLFPRQQILAPAPVARLDRPSKLRPPPRPATPRHAATADPASAPATGPVRDKVQQVQIVGRVLGGGSHRVAGCPDGDVHLTTDDGRFEIRIPLDHSCALRVARSDATGLYLGDAVDINGTSDVVVELVAADAPLTQQEVDVALDRLRAMSVQRLTALESELSTTSDPGLTEDLQSQLDQAMHRQQRVSDPDQAMDVIEEWVFGMFD